jgi:hypothetical protein
MHSTYLRETAGEGRLEDWESGVVEDDSRGISGVYLSIIVMQVGGLTCSIVPSFHNTGDGYCIYPMSSVDCISEDEKCMSPHIGL